MKQLKQQYFQDKSYFLLYIHKAGKNFAGTIFRIFSTAYLFHHGLPLPWLIFYHGLEFGLRGFFSPLSYKLISSFGIARSYVIATFFFACFFITTSFAETSLIIAYCGLIFYSIGGGIYYPFSDVMEALYVKEDHHRGRQMSFGMVCSTLSSILSAILAGYLLEHYTYFYVALLAIAGHIIALFPLFYLKQYYRANVKMLDVYSFARSKEYRPYGFSFLAEQLAIVMQYSIPIFIFLIVGHFDTLGYLIFAATLVELLVTLFFGQYIDKVCHKKALNSGFYFTSLSSLFYIFLASTPFTAFLTESYNKISWNIYQSGFLTKVHRQVSKKFDDLLLFGAAYQMTLCYGEIVAFGIYAIIAYFIGTNVFALIFLVSIIGVYLSIYFLKKSL